MDKTESESGLSGIKSSETGELHRPLPAIFGNLYFTKHIFPSFLPVRHFIDDLLSEQSLLMHIFLAIINGEFLNTPDYHNKKI